jgi:lipopolysaccharide transport system permease protein
MSLSSARETPLGGTVARLRKLYQYRGLLWMWTFRGIKARYQQTILGAGWAILQPLSLTAIYVIVFSVFLKIDTADIPYPLFVYSGLLPWTLFSGSVALAVPSIVRNMDLVTKIFFPREILPLSSIGIPLVDFLVGSLILVLFTLGYGYRFPVTALWVIVLVVLQLLFTLGLALFGSALNVLFRDIGHLVGPVLVVWQFATPIVYPVEAVPENLRSLYFLNPMAALIDSYKRVLLLELQPRWGPLLVTLALSIVLLAAGYWFFSRAERVFADVV